MAAAATAALVAADDDGLLLGFISQPKDVTIPGDWAEWFIDPSTSSSFRVRDSDTGTRINVADHQSFCYPDSDSK